MCIILFLNIIRKCLYKYSKTNYELYLQDFDNSNFDDQYIWIQVPGLGPHHEPEIGSPEMPYSAPPLIPNPPESPECEPKIKWNGPSELLLDRRDVSGL